MAGRLSALDLERFESFVDRSGNCHVWTGGLTRGYGTFWLQGKTERAHRVAYEIEHGSVPAGLHVLHHCDTPACVTQGPDHLFVGSQADNMHDMKNKRRARAPRGSQHWNWRGAERADAGSIREGGTSR